MQLSQLSDLPCIRPHGELVSASGRSCLQTLSACATYEKLSTFYCLNQLAAALSVLIFSYLGNFHLFVNIKIGKKDLVSVSFQNTHFYRGDNLF